MVCLLVFLIALGGWAAYLYSYGNGRLTKVDALSGAAPTSGTTHLIVGSDKRSEAVPGEVEGERADTIMLLHVPDSGPTALVSIPRDTLVTFPGSQNTGKINAAYSYGGPEYLVQTVEALTGLTIDSYVEIGMDGVLNLTDAVGGIELCLDYDVSDSMSGLEWTSGCHTVDGPMALAFARMRYSDPLGDIGRNERQRQVVSAIIGEALSPETILNPIAQRDLVGSATEVLTVHEGGSLMTVARAGLALRSAIGEGGLMGSPPIESLNYPGPGGSSTVLLAPEAKQFWVDLRDGNLTEESFASF
ncbi:LCP family protein [Trueperella bonasi]|uniref:LCP family protein n=1 Tax=Trueperella bonasi TaxID=312286 RepID=UPI0027D7742F|nr:LCP family protein [Trueperella bonasi]